MLTVAVSQLQLWVVDVDNNPVFGQSNFDHVV
jgi:hypothetical protein